MGTEVIAKTLHRSELKNKLLPLLYGRVFHVTTKEAYSSIICQKIIRNNMREEFSFVFPQSKNSYGRKRGYVCLFDLRSATPCQIQDALLKYDFLNPFEGRSDPYFFIVSSSGYSHLIKNSDAKSEIGYKEMWIPYVECWFPHDLPLEYINKIIKLKIK